MTAGCQHLLLDAVLAQDTTASSRKKLMRGRGRVYAKLGLESNLRSHASCSVGAVLTTHATTIERKEASGLRPAERQHQQQQQQQLTHAHKHIPVLSRAKTTSSPADHRAAQLTRDHTSIHIHIHN